MVHWPLRLESFVDGVRRPVLKALDTHRSHCPPGQFLPETFLGSLPRQSCTTSTALWKTNLKFADFHRRRFSARRPALRTSESPLQNLRFAALSSLVHLLRGSPVQRFTYEFIRRSVVINCECAYHATGSDFFTIHWIH